MKKYYIYHIPGVKIGCTSELEKRISDQGFTDYEILETHEDIYVASEREKELQREYGYRGDGPHYWQSIEARAASGHIGGTNNIPNLIRLSSEAGKKGGPITAKQNRESGRWDEVRLLGASAGGNVEWHCTECDRIYKAAGAYGHRKATGHTITRIKNN